MPRIFETTVSADSPPAPEMDEKTVTIDATLSRDNGTSSLRIHTDAVQAMDGWFTSEKYVFLSDDDAEVLSLSNAVAEGASRRVRITVEFLD